MPTPENQPPFDHRRDHTTRLVESLLKRMTADMPISFAYAYTYCGDLDELQLVATYPVDALTPQADEQLQTILIPKLSMIEAEPHAIQDEELEGMGFLSAVACGLMMGDELIGILGVHSQQPGAYPADTLLSIRDWADHVESALQNRRLRDDQIVTQVIQQVARVIGENPEPQDLVDLLREKMCGPHVSTCVMMFYGPLREDRPNGPFDYLEVRGNWSRRAGSGSAQGIKIYLDQYPDLLTRFDEHRVIITTVDESIMNQYDPLIRGMLRAEEIKSMLRVALHAGQQQIQQDQAGRGARL